MKKIYLFGNGGHALSCIDAIERQKIAIITVLSKLISFEESSSESLR